MRGSPSTTSVSFLNAFIESLVRAFSSLCSKWGAAFIPTSVWNSSQPHWKTSRVGWSRLIHGYPPSGNPHPSRPAIAEYQSLSLPSVGRQDSINAG